MSVNDLLDLLEDLVNENTKPGFSGKCVLKSKDILSIINDMRTQLPTEIQAANHVRREKNKLIIEAQKQADDMMTDAQAATNRMVLETDVVQQANIYSKKLISEAENEAFELKRGTCNYLDRRMGELISRLGDLEAEINESRRELREYIAMEAQNSGNNYEEDM